MRIMTDTFNNAYAEPDGLLDAWLLDGEGGGRRLGWEAITDCQPGEKECLWVHLDYSRSEVQQWMWDSSGLSELTVEALLQAETRPRCVTADNGLMVFLRGVNLNPGADPEDMVSIRMWVGDRRIISLRMRRLLSVDDLREFIVRGSGPKTSGDFVVMLVDHMLGRAGEVVDELYDKVDALEETADQAPAYRQRTELADIRRQAISLRRFFAPQREALNRLSMERATALTEEHRLHLREGFDRLTRMVEELDEARERAGVIHESLVSRIAEQTNQRMYILSVIAAIFLPLSFLTGLLGINVGGIPGANSELGFFVVVALMLGIGGGLWIYFRLRRWF